MRIFDNDRIFIETVSISLHTNKIGMIGKDKDNINDKHKFIWTDMDKTNKNVCIAPAIQPGI